MTIELVPASAPAGVPRGMTHLPDQPCPFENRFRGKGPHLTCCSYRPIEETLFFVGAGLSPWWTALGDWKDPEESIVFAESLRALSAEYQRFVVVGWMLLGGAAFNDPESILSDAVLQVPGAEEVPLPTAIERLGALADWFEQIGRLSCRVEPKVLKA